MGLVAWNKNDWLIDYDSQFQFPLPVMFLTNAGAVLAKLTPCPMLDDAHY